jgi:hypothetical protein
MDGSCVPARSWPLATMRRTCSSNWRYMGTPEFGFSVNMCGIVTECITMLMHKNLFSQGAERGPSHPADGRRRGLRRLGKGSPQETSFFSTLMRRDETSPSSIHHSSGSALNVVRTINLAVRSEMNLPLKNAVLKADLVDVGTRLIDANEFDPLKRAQGCQPRPVF